MTGKIEQGVVKTGDEMEIVGGDQRGKTMKTTCTGARKAFMILQLKKLKHMDGQVLRCSKKCLTEVRPVTTSAHCSVVSSAKKLDEGR
eukprot:SAG11_NODE_98_length_16927_cov_35.166211_16_plen_88_part_00